MTTWSNNPVTCSHRIITTFCYLPFRFPPLCFPIPPIASPFLARTPSLLDAFDDISLSNAPPALDVVFLALVLLGVEWTGIPILAGRAAFFAERIAAFTAPI